MPLRFRELGFNIRSAVRTSPEDEDYNCVAWAAGETDRFWWPEPDPEFYYWPDGVPYETTPDAFVAAFETLGYERCESVVEAVDPTKFEVVAFYQRDHEIRHVARQLPSGLWTSKMGPSIDMTHRLEELAGVGYGGITILMKRPRTRGRSRIGADSR